jgi:hypothetical protein
LCQAYADQDDVEEYRRHRGSEIAAQRIQHAGHHGAERHADQVGKHDGRKPDRHVELSRRVGKARGHQVAHDQRHRQFHGDGQRQQRREQDAEHLFGKALGAVGAVRLDLLGKERHEGSVEGSFGKQPAKGVGELEGGVEGVGDRPGAECGRHQHLTDETKSAAHQRAGSDRRELFDKAHASGDCLQDWDK